MVGIADPGGVRTYINKVSEWQHAAGHTVVLFDHISRESEKCADVTYVLDPQDLFVKCQAVGIEIVHTHTSLGLTGTPLIPTLRTVHNHAPFCPSGTQYLANAGKPCSHVFTPHICILNHFTQHCGSMRPNKLREEFEAIKQERRDAKFVNYVTVSEFMRDRMIRSGYPADKIVVNYLPAPHISNIADVEHAGSKRILFVGRLTQLKGLQWLLAAMRHISHDVVLDVAGDGPERQGLESLVKSFSLHDRVTFHGWLHSNALAMLYEGCDCVVFPSLWHEPGGTVAFEAMAHSKPIVMSAVGGMPEVVQNNHNGLLVAPNDTPGLVRAIERLVGDSTYAKTLGEQGRHDITAHFTTDKHMAVLEEIYQRCLGTHEQTDSCRTNDKGACRD